VWLGEVVAGLLLTAVLFGCGGGSDSPTTASEAVEGLGLNVLDAGPGNQNYGLPDSHCVAEKLFFGEKTAAQYQGHTGVVIADGDDWGVQLTADSRTSKCVDAWEAAMG